MKNKLRFLTQDEIEKFPGMSSVNVAVLSNDSKWYYGDYNAMDGAQFVADEGGAYIPLQD